MRRTAHTRAGLHDLILTETYLEEEKSTETPKNVTSKIVKYKCAVCGYIYDPEKGDPDGDIKPGTDFEDIPDGWVCPVCGAAKDQFEKVD